ncbi:MAG: BrnT family toxin [Geobacteraceae bacterium]|nr:BrnT family toxin [Geobacteraceae bacterium]
MSFEVACLVFDDPFHLCCQDRIVDGEERWQTIGMVGGVLLLLVAHTWEDAEGEMVIRVVSARKADARERKRYEEETY